LYRDTDEATQDVRAAAGSLPIAFGVSSLRRHAPGCFSSAGAFALTATTLRRLQGERKPPATSRRERRKTQPMSATVIGKFSGRKVRVVRATADDIEGDVALHQLAIDAVKRGKVVGVAHPYPSVTPSFQTLLTFRDHRGLRQRGRSYRGPGRRGHPGRRRAESGLRTDHPLGRRAAHGGRAFVQSRCMAGPPHGPPDPFRDWRRFVRQMREPSDPRAPMRRALQRDRARFLRQLEALRDPAGLQRTLRQMQRSLGGSRSTWAAFQRELNTLRDPQRIARIRSQAGLLDAYRATHPSRQMLADWDRLVQQLQDPTGLQRLKAQLADKGQLWQRQMQNLGNPEPWRALQRQLAAFRDPAVLEELRRQASVPPAEDVLQALREGAESLDDLASAAAAVGDEAQTVDDMSWVDAMPLATAARLFLTLLEYSIALVAILGALGTVPATIAPALTFLHKVLVALQKRLERETKD